MSHLCAIIVSKAYRACCVLRIAPNCAIHRQPAVHRGLNRIDKNFCRPTRKKIKPTVGRHAQAYKKAASFNGDLSARHVGRQIGHCEHRVRRTSLRMSDDFDTIQSTVKDDIIGNVLVADSSRIQWWIFDHMRAVCDWLQHLLHEYLRYCRSLWKWA